MLQKRLKIEKVLVCFQEDFYQTFKENNSTLEMFNFFFIITEKHSA